MSTYPLDLIRTRLTIQTTEGKYHGIVDTFKKVVNEEGIRALYKGVGTSALVNYVVKRKLGRRLTRSIVHPLLQVFILRCSYTLFKGIAPYVAINFATYDGLKRIFVRDRSVDLLESLVYGGIAGATAQTGTFDYKLI